MLGRIAAAAALLVTCALLIGCSRSAPGAAAVGPSDDRKPPTAIDDGSAVAALRLYSGAQAAAFRKNISALDAIDCIRKASSRSAAKPELGLQGFGARMAGPVLPIQEAGQIAKGLTLLQSGAQGPGPSGGEASGWEGMAALPKDPLTGIDFEGDTSWFVRDDSAQGSIHWIHVFHDAEDELFSLVRDSLVYKWPYDDKAPMLVASHTQVRHLGGGEDRLSLTDDDGDGTLLGAPEGKTVRIRKERAVARGDTAFKSVWHTDHGDWMRFADTTLVNGKAVAWMVTSDGDGDGLALQAAGSAPVVIQNEGCSLDGTGARTCVTSIQGAGADADPMTPFDNPIHRYTVTHFSPAGDTLSVSAFGDGDGDGLYSSPAPGSANRIWETHRYMARDGFKAYRDSSVRHLNAIDDERDDQVVYHAAAAIYADGGVATLTSGTGDGRGRFGREDTVRVRERITYAALVTQGAGESDSASASSTSSLVDSVVRTALILPGDLADAGDDRILSWSSLSQYRIGPEGNRKWRRDEFDPVTQSLTWEEHLYFADGDSITITGSRPKTGMGSYAFSPTHHAARSGGYDADDGRIRDTVRYLDRTADGPAYDIREGAFQEGNGTGLYTLKRVLGNGDSAVTRLVLNRQTDGGLAVSAISGTDTCLYHVLGDRARWTMKKGDSTFAFASAALGDGGYRVTQTIVNGDGNLVAEGTYLFGRDGAGVGSLRQHSGYGAGMAVDIGIAADGAVVVGAESAEGLALKP